MKTSELLTRVDNKYLVNTNQFESIFSLVTNKYRLLTIEGVNNFGYRSRYFDSEYTSYLDHHKGKRNRFKIRLREYVDSGNLFLELKLKGTRGQTVKFREPCSTFNIHQLDQHMPYYFIAKKWYEEKYCSTFPETLTSTLIIYYSRFALVSNASQERVTVDTNIVFQDAISGSQWRLSGDVSIVETKTAKGAGTMDALLKKRGYRQASKCSKYCVGLALGNHGLKKNRFLPVIRSIRNTSLMT